MGAFWYTLQEMRKHWDRIDIICPRVPEGSLGMSESGHRLESDVKEGGEVFFHPCPKSLVFQIPWIVSKGKHLITEHKHDVMTVHDYPPFYNGIAAKKLYKITKIPYVIEVHHIVGWPKSATLSEWIGRQMSWLYLKADAQKASAVRVVNHSVEKQLKKWGVPGRKIENISSFYLDKNILSAVHRPPVSYDISFCGRLVANKGLSELIDALGILKDARLLIIGDGPERARMEEKVKSMEIENRVTFLGWLPTQEAVTAAIQTARIFVMNSKSEGGPRIALEAMACGMPVIVTNVGVMPEVIVDGKNGIITTGDPEDLGKKIGLLLNNSTQQESLGKEAMKILDVFERETLIKQYADFLKSQT
jgi:glycosyltransferase involved in cell wall biosynthesis